MSKKSKLSYDEEIKILNYLQNNPNCILKDVCKKFGVSYRIIERIRKSNNIYHGFTKHIKGDESEQILKFMQNNPLVPYNEIISIFGCTYSQATKIRSKDQTLPSLMKATVRKKHRVFLSTDIENEIVEFMEANVSCNYDDIVNRFNCSIRQVEKIRRDRNFPPIKRRPVTTKQSLLKKENKRYCPSCDTIKSLEEFHQYRVSCCKECETKRTALRSGQNDLTLFLQTKLKQSLKRHLIHNSLKLEDLLNAYSTQNGKCFYSGRTMTLKSNDPNSLSIDRIDSSIGYTVDNIVLCCSIVNYMKQEYKYGDFITLCNEISTLHSVSIN
jgi:CRISPR/Cas system Type II protein with McrA/HNH and RuvC-like nuclease domain